MGLFLGSVESKTFLAVSLSVTCLEDEADWVQLRLAGHKVPLFSF